MKKINKLSFSFVNFSIFLFEYERVFRLKLNWICLYYHRRFVKAPDIDNEWWQSTSEVTTSNGGK